MGPIDEDQLLTTYLINSLNDNPHFREHPIKLNLFGQRPKFLL
jgi:hypothetical protein